MLRVPRTRYQPLLTIIMFAGGVGVLGLSDYAKSTKLLASTTLRTILGTKNLAEILSDREFIAKDILAHLDGATDPWGIQVRWLKIRRIAVQSEI